MNTVRLGPRQERTAAVAVTVLSVTVIVAACAVLLYLVGLFARTFASVFLPLAVAGIVALVCKPWFDFLRVKGRLPTPLAIAAFLLSVLLPIAAFLWFFGALAASQISDLVARGPELWERANELFRARWPAVEQFLLEHNLTDRAQEAATAYQEELTKAVGVLAAGAFTAGKGVLSWIGALFGWAVFPVYLVFFLLAPPGGLDALERHLAFLKSETRRDVVYLVRELVTILVSFFRGQLVIAAAQGALFAIGFSIVGLSYGFLLGLVLGLLNIIPYLGSIVGLGIAIPLAFLQDGGGLSTAIAVVVVFTVVQLIEGYLLTPRIMGDRTGLHPMAIIVAVFFWGTALGGILGMILAIPLTAFAVVVWRLVREKYVAELV